MKKGRRVALIETQFNFKIEDIINEEISPLMH